MGNGYSKLVKEALKNPIKNRFSFYWKKNVCYEVLRFVIWNLNLNICCWSGDENSSTTTNFGGKCRSCILYFLRVQDPELRGAVCDERKPWNIPRQTSCQLGDIAGDLCWISCWVSSWNIIGECLEKGYVQRIRALGKDLKEKIGTESFSKFDTRFIRRQVRFFVHRFIYRQVRFFLHIFIYRQVGFLVHIFIRRHVSFFVHRFIRRQVRFFLHIFIYRQVGFFLHRFFPQTGQFLCT